ncbi:MAG: hypothetical protein A2729_04965 [Candidatus Buchananbacteria bacterium RIFCSPHIGHO2_01_FULL_39_14]|uniref:Uncharacterized protein n=1 Tax=Candidatus Buchananbacteria bacterium RIFCSPHIGHO2_01_FULL_39_14 TaxID=1797532 RepID=A0A1G1XSN4_9BACT|nr:MAG: hypothetical protein A2729_04965 [Candidatus Buchananbacteria bacterium RIFCSPHIGHO2_01_FULL_39_14]
MSLETLLKPFDIFDNVLLNYSSKVAKKIHLDTDKNKRYATTGLFLGNTALYVDLYFQTTNLFLLSVAALSGIALPLMIKSIKGNDLHLSIKYEGYPEDNKALQFNPLRIYRKSAITAALLGTGMYIGIKLNSDNHFEPNQEHKIIDYILSFSTLSTIAYLNSPTTPQPTPQSPSLSPQSKNIQPITHTPQKTKDEWIYFD